MKKILVGIATVTIIAALITVASEPRQGTPLREEKTAKLQVSHPIFPEIGSYGHKMLLSSLFQAYRRFWVCLI